MASRKKPFKRRRDKKMQYCKPHFEIPEALTAQILSRASPRDVIRFSLVNRAFYEAAQSDIVWEKKLPESYLDILNQAKVPVVFSSKKDLFTQLSNHILLGDGNEGLWLDCGTGAICRSFSAKSFAVTWGSTAEYWQWSPKLGARFHEVAHLKMVCWLELSGHWQLTLSPGTYTVSWRLQLDSDAFGWDKEPLRFCLSTVEGLVARSSCFLVNAITQDSSGEDDSDDDEPVSVARVREVGDGWLECDIGEIVIESDASSEVELFFSMQEITSGGWKGGLFIDGVVLQPSYVLPNEF